MLVLSRQGYFNSLGEGIYDGKGDCTSHISLPNVFIALHLTFLLLSSFLLTFFFSPFQKVSVNKQSVHKTLPHRASEAVVLPGFLGEECPIEPRASTRMNRLAVLLLRE